VARKLCVESLVCSEADRIHLAYCSCSCRHSSVWDGDVAWL